MSVIASDNGLPVISTQRISLEPALQALPDPPKEPPWWAQDYGHSPTRPIEIVSSYTASQEQVEGIRPSIEDMNFIERDILASTVQGNDFKGKISVSFLVRMPNEYNENFSTSYLQRISRNTTISFIAFKEEERAEVESLIRRTTQDGRPLVGVDNFHFTQTTLEEVLHKNSIRSELATNTSTRLYNDYHSEIVIDFEDTNLDTLSLMGIVTYEDRNVHNAGNYTYDSLLVQNDAGNLSIPVFTNIFYVQDPATPADQAKPYYGPVHYHSEESPAPDGYIGWMAGHNIPDQMGQKLVSRRIRNYKVSSAIHSFLPNQDVFSISSMTGINENSTGNRLESFLSHFIDLESMNNRSYEIIERANVSMLAEARSSNATFITKNTDLTTSIQVDRRDLSNSCYRSVLGIDFLNILKYNSSYGDLICFQEERENSQFLDACIYHSEIANMTVKRRRIVEDPYHFNDADTKMYTKFNKNTQDLIVAQGADIKSRNYLLSTLGGRIRDRFLGHRGARAAITEIELLDIGIGQDNTDLTLNPGSAYTRHFVLRDYDLFHNVNIGCYTYIVEVTLKDGISTAISNIYNRIQLAIKNVNDYISLSQEPIVYDNQGLVVGGNFDPYKNIVSEEFKNNQEVIENVNSAIDSLIESIALFSGRKMSNNQVFQLRNYLHPSSFNPESVEYFHGLLQKIGSCILNILKGGGNSQQDVQQPFHSDKSSVKYTSNVNSGLVHASSKTKIVADAFTPTTVMTDYGFLEAYLSGPFDVPRSNVVYNSPSVTRHEPTIPTIEVFSDHLMKQEEKNLVNAGDIKPEFFYTVDPNSFKVLSDSPYGITTSLSTTTTTSEATGLDPLGAIIDPNAILFPIPQPMVPTVSPAPTVQGYQTTATTVQGVIDFASSRIPLEQAIQAISAGSVNLLLGKQEYDGMSSSKKSIADLQISAFKNSDTTYDGTTNKGGTYAPFYLFSQSGINFNIGLGVLSNSGLVDLVLKFQGPNISESLVKSLCDSFNESDEKEEYELSVLDGVKQLASLKNDFFDVFQMMANMASYSNNISTDIPTRPTEDLYLENKREYYIKPPIPSDPFDEEISSPFVHSTESEGIKINLNNFRMENKISTESEKKFILVRLERKHSEANVRPVNDSILIEV